MDKHRRIISQLGQLAQKLAHPTRLVIGGLVALVSGAGAEPLLEGRVRLPSGATPAGVQVRLFDIADLGSSLGATTDESGYFALPLTALRKAAPLPAHMQLGQNYPNPFNPSTIIPYQLPAPTRVRLEVFNILGQRVATLVDGQQTAGFHTATWNAADASGRGVATGVYLYRLLAGGERLTRSMVLLDGAVGSAGGAGSGGAAGTSAGRQGIEDAADPSSRTARAVATGSGSWVPPGGQGQVYGLTVTGPGLIPYVDPAFRVGDGPVEIRVETLASLPRGKMAAGGLLGDVDNNGQVDLSDALLVASYSEDPSLSIPNGDITLGDVNRDGQVDLADARLIVAYHADPSDLSLPDGIGAPVGADDEGPRLYWTDAGSDRIQRAHLDGSGVEDVVDSGLVYPRGLAVDLAASKLYWTDYGTDKIQRANLDGSEIEDLVTNGLQTPLALALDAVAGKLYWSDNGTDKIQRANLDGSEVEDLVTGLQSPLSLALDVAGGKLFWTDSGTDMIQRANLDGTQVEDLVTEGLRTSQAIALDLAAGKMYWTDYGTDKIQRANLDGSEVEDLVTTGLKEPYGLTLGAGLPAQILKVEGEAATLNLAGRFRDPEGGSLTYTVLSSDEAVATASLMDSELTIMPVAPGRVAVAVTARDEGGMETTLPVAVTVEPETPETSSDGAVTVEPKTPETSGGGAVTVEPETPTKSGGGGSNTGGGGGTPPPTQNNAPDLVIESPSVSNSSPDAATSFTLSVTVRNSGNGSSASTTLRYYRSTDRSISSSDTQVGTGEVGALTASGTNSEEIEIGLTAPTDAGTYYYGACVDAVSGESATGNNCSSGVQVTVTVEGEGPAPDLVVLGLNVSDSTLETGETFGLFPTVHNQGNGSSSATTLRYYRSTDRSISSSDTQVGTGEVGALTASGTNSISVKRSRSV